MRPDCGNGAIHTDERCGYSGEDPYAVSDFKVTHNKRSPSFSKTGEWQAWEEEGGCSREEGRRRDENYAPAAGNYLVSTTTSAAVAAAKVSLDHRPGFIDGQHSTVEFRPA